MGWRNILAWKDELPKSPVSREQAREMVGKHVDVNSYLIKHKPGIIKQYLDYPKHHFWVYMDEPYETMSGKMSRWHKCNAGNCKVIENE